MILLINGSIVTTLILERTFGSYLFRCNAYNVQVAKRIQ